jgi:hypothetical protein
MFLHKLLILLVQIADKWDDKESKELANHHQHHSVKGGGGGGMRAVGIQRSSCTTLSASTECSKSLCFDALFFSVHRCVIDVSKDFDKLYLATNKKKQTP